MWALRLDNFASTTTAVHAKVAEYGNEAATSKTILKILHPK